MLSDKDIAHNTRETYKYLVRLYAMFQLDSILPEVNRFRRCLGLSHEQMKKDIKAAEEALEE